MDDRKQELIRELALTNSMTDVYLLFQEVKDLKARLSMELDFQQRQRNKQKREFHAFMAELWETLDQIRAKHLIDTQLLNLVRGSETNAGDQRKERAQTQTDRVSSYRR
jgi:hypothetical protein